MKSRLLQLAATVIAVAVGFVAFNANAEPTNAQEDDPLAVFENMVAAFNEGIPSGDGDVIASAFTEGGLFTNRDDAFAAVGRSAIAFAFTFDDPDATFQATVTETVVDGDTVTGSADIVDQDTLDAGVASHVELFTATVEDGLVSSFVLTYGDDPDTQTYLDYLANLPDDGDDDPFPDAVEIALAGDQPGMAFIADFPDVTDVSAVAIEVEPGPEGEAQPAHVHTGSCDDLGGVVYPLAYPLDGSSFTLLSTTQAELLSSGYVINVHLSEAAHDTYVACGALGEADDTDGGTTGLPNTGTGGATDSSDASWLIAALAVVGIAGVAGAGVAASRRR